MTSAFEHPFLSGLLGDEEVAQLLGVEAELAAMAAFEGALATVQARLGLIPPEAGAAIAAAAADLPKKNNMMALRDATARDGVVVPELVRQLRSMVGEPHGRYAHFGATSQDVIDTALALRVGPVLAVLELRLHEIIASIARLRREFGGGELMAFTRMQAALPIHVADRLIAWSAPLERDIMRLGSVRASIQVVQLGGAVGTLDAYGDKGAAVRAELARTLGLGDAPQWHSQRDRVADLANWLSLVSGSLGKIGQDVALMASRGEIGLTGGGASSAMAHKQNPVGAEILVSLARFNAALLGGFHQALVHEQERSGAAWTLEWLILEQMMMTTSASSRATAHLLSGVTAVGSARPG